jgi:hypothetical protein
VKFTVTVFPLTVVLLTLPFPEVIEALVSVTGTGKVKRLYVIGSRLPHATFDSMR